MPSSSILVRGATFGLLALGLLAAAESLRWPGARFPGFLVMPNRVVPSVGLPGWSGVDEGRPLYQQVVVAVDDVPVTSAAAVYDAVARRAPGTLVSYQVVRQGTLDTRVSPIRTFGWDTHVLIFGAYLLSGLAYLLLAAVAGERWRASPLFPALVIFSWAAATFALTGIDLYGAGRLFRLQAFAEAILPAAAAHLALVCPQNRLGRRVGVLPLVYGIGLALAAIYQVFLYEPAAYSAIHNCCQALVGAALLALTLGLGLGVHEPAADLDVTALRWCLAGALAGFVVPALVLGISGLAGGLVPVNATAWFSFAFPVAGLMALRARSKHAAAVRSAAPALA